MWEYQIVIGVKNIDLDFLQDYQPLCLGISIPLLFAPYPTPHALCSICPMPYALCSLPFLLPTVFRFPFTVDRFLSSDPWPLISVSYLLSPDLRPLSSDSYFLFSDSWPLTPDFCFLSPVSYFLFSDSWPPTSDLRPLTSVSCLLFFAFCLLKYIDKNAKVCKNLPLWKTL